MAGGSINANFHILRRFRSESIEVFGENDTWRRDKFEVAVAFYDDAIRSNVVSLQIFGEQLTGDGETPYAAGECRRLRLWERINRNGCGRRGALYLYADFTSAIEEGLDGIRKIDRAANNRAGEIDTGDGELAFLLREDKVLQDAARGRRPSVAALQTCLYGRVGYFLRTPALELGLAAHHDILQAYADNTMHAIGEQNGFLSKNAETAGRHSNKKVSTIYRSVSRNLRGGSAAIACGVGGLRLSGRTRYVNGHGAGVKRFSAYLY